MDKDTTNKFKRELVALLDKYGLHSIGGSYEGDTQGTSDHCVIVSTRNCEETVLYAGGIEADLYDLREQK